MGLPSRCRNGGGDLSWRSAGWRIRAAYVRSDLAFEAEYVVCQSCETGWVEAPHCYEGYKRCGLASAALRSLRQACPGVLNGHVRGARARQHSGKACLRPRERGARPALAGHLVAIDEARPSVRSRTSLRAAPRQAGMKPSLQSWNPRSDCALETVVASTDMESWYAGSGGRDSGTD